MFDQPTNVATKLLYIDDKTGVLTTTMMPGRRLDREELCDGSQEECVLSLDVVVLPYFQLVKVRVDVVDVNDNAPVIELADGGIQLYESAELGTEVRVGIAWDLDTRRHGIDSCRLDDIRCAVTGGQLVCDDDNIRSANTSSMSFFSIVVRRRLDDVRVVDLYARLISTLDRETDGNFLVGIYFIYLFIFYFIYLFA